MATIQLVGDGIAVMIEPGHGASITHLGATLSPSDNVLAWYDWRTPLPARSGPGYGDTTDDWLSEYRGGWQLLTPNAGDECVVAGVRHPCHGEVSRARWVVTESGDTSATMWTGTHAALTVTRTIAIEGSGIRATTMLANETSVPAQAILVEHVAFAGGEDSLVIAPDESRWNLHPRAAAAADVAWAESGLVHPVPAPGSKVVSLAARSEGWVELHRPSLDRGIRMEWDAVELPYLWYWQERGSTQFPWFGRADVVGLEPASASRFDGLAGAVGRGESWTVAAGSTVSVSVSVALVQCRTSARAYIL